MFRFPPRTRRRGAAMLEVALTLPVLLSIVLGMVEFARYQMVRQMAISAARVGVRTAVDSKRSASTAAVQQAVLAQLAGSNLSAFQVSVAMTDPSGNALGDWTLAPRGQPIGVTVTLGYAPIFPTLGILSNPMLLRAQSVMRCEFN